MLRRQSIWHGTNVKLSAMLVNRPRLAVGQPAQQTFNLHFILGSPDSGFLPFVLPQGHSPDEPYYSIHPHESQLELTVF